MSEKQIETVSGLMDKKKTYAYQMKRFNIAVKNEFYFEAMLIVYAMIEDRLIAFLYHSGVIADRNGKLTFGTTKNKECLREIVQTYGGLKPNQRIILSQIGNKRIVIKALMQWLENADSITPDMKYLWTLKNQYESLDAGELSRVIDEMEDWLRYRNELIHALMNKNVESTNKQLSMRVEEGMYYARFIDSQVKIIKKGGKIRKSVNLSAK